MKPLILLIALAGLSIAGVASAHAHLHVSTPANHSVVTAAPKQIRLEFNEPVQLTSVTIQIGDGAATKLGPLPATAAKEFSLAVPRLEAGNCIVKWRAVSDDGHIMADKLLFTIGSAN